MVNSTFTAGARGSGEPDAEWALVRSYALSDRRDGLDALFTLDAVFARILRRTREPMVGQMRLTWWYEALRRLDDGAPPAEPVLQALATHVLPSGVTGSALSRLIDGWEDLLDSDSPDEAVILRHGNARGAAIFGMAGIVLGAGHTDPLADAGLGWALSDLSRHLADDPAAARAAELAQAALVKATRMRWSRAGRPLGALAALARMNLAIPRSEPLPIGAPTRVLRLLRLRLTGR